MKKEEIFIKLKDETKINNLKSPSKIDFEIDDKTRILIITVNSELAEKENMQKDNLAFESWMLCIKASKHLHISKVELSWKPSNTTSAHYNRFKFRVMKCQDYFDWFSVDKNCETEINSFRKEFIENRLVLNYPNKEASERAENKESFLEREFLKNKKLYKNVTFDNRDHQLPVGVFKGNKSRESLFFTGGKSAIDLWASKDDEFWIFELKFENKMIGIITELLFYMWLCEEIFIKHHIVYDDNDKGVGKSLRKSYRSFNQLYTLSKSGINRVYGVMLYDNNSIHQLITELSVIKYMNEYLISKDLKVLEQSYKTHPLSIELK